MLINPRLYKGKTNSRGKNLTNIRCEICNGNARIKRRIDPTKELSPTNQIRACRSCHTTLMRMFEKAAKELKLYDTIYPIDLINELRAKKFQKDDEIETWTPSPDSDYWNDKPKDSTE